MFIKSYNFQTFVYVNVERKTKSIGLFHTKKFTFISHDVFLATSQKLELFWKKNIFKKMAIYHKDKKINI